MPHFENWSNLVEATAGHALAPLSALRPGSLNVREFSEDGKAYLAVRGQAPYGAVAPADLQSAPITGLLTPVEATRSFTLFELPEDSLSLSAVTLGTGERHFDALLPIYRKVGSMLFTIMDRTGLRMPLLEVTDIALDRSSGDVFMVPPVEIGRGTRNGTAHALKLGGSLIEHFQTSVDPDVLADLSLAFEGGFKSDGTA